MDDAILNPTGHHIVVEIEKAQEKTAGGIIIPEMKRERQMNEGEISRLLAVGSQAWKAFSDGTPWAKVGDRLLCIKHAGHALPWNPMLRIMNDEDVLAVLGRAPEEA